MLRTTVGVVAMMVILPVVGGVALHSFFSYREWQKVTDAWEIYETLQQPVHTPAESPVLGRADAPVTIEIYSDFQCPYCIRFFQREWESVVKELVETGKAKVVYRYLPLPFHPYARDAAKVAMCAAVQGKFWHLHDLLYEHGRSLSRPRIWNLAERAGVSRTQLGQCLKEHEKDMEEFLKETWEQARKQGIMGTPSIVINGKVYHNIPFHYIQEVVDSLIRASS